jgi:hypothetical protein
MPLPSGTLTFNQLLQDHKLLTLQNFIIQCPALQAITLAPIFIRHLDFWAVVAAS